MINSALGAGISWDDISTMVATETAAGVYVNICYLWCGVLRHMHWFFLHFINRIFRFLIYLCFFQGNPIASLITKLKLEKNRVIIRLPDILADSDSDDDSDEDDDHDDNSKSKKSFVDVDLDLSLSAYANASKLYSQRKVARSKEQKTAVAAERAIKAVRCCNVAYSIVHFASLTLFPVPIPFSSTPNAHILSHTHGLVGRKQQLESTGQAASQA